MKISIISIALLSVFYTSHVLADDEVKVPDWHSETLTGDWGGLRTSLFQQGVNIGLVHKSDVLANTNGGIKRGTTWMGHTEAQVTMDLDKLLGLQSMTAFVHYHSDLGGKFNTHYVGGFVGEDNIEVATNTAQFYQAWLQKNWFDDHLSVLAGLYAIDTEFYVNQSTGIFIQAPYGMANEVAQSGKSGPPIFPLGALGIRAKLLSPSKQWYVQAALTDGVPGDPDDPRGTHIKLGDGDGTMSIMEFGFTPQIEEENAGEQLNKIAIGMWRFTTPLDDLVKVDINGDPIKKHSEGAYFLAEHTFFNDKKDSIHSLTGFFRYGMASENVHQADWSSSAGVHYHGLIAGRNEDVLGFAATVNHPSSAYKKTTADVGTETDYELTYQAYLRPWLIVQPTLQYIVNPGMDKTIKNASVIGIRTEVHF